MSLPILSEPSPEELVAMREELKLTEVDDCLSWHKFCHSECCAQYSLEDKGQDLSLKKIRVYGSALPDIIRYYELHGAKYRMPWLYIPTKNAKRHNGRIFILDRCSALTADNKCKFHGTNAKPKVCQELNFTNVKKGLYYGGAKITPRCRYTLIEEGNK